MAPATLHVHMGWMSFLVPGFEARPDGPREVDRSQLTLLVTNHRDDVRYQIRSSGGEHSFPPPAARGVLLLWPGAAAPPTELSPFHLFRFEKGGRRWPVLGFGPPGEGPLEHPFDAALVWRDSSVRFAHEWTSPAEGGDDYSFREEGPAVLWWWAEGEETPRALHGAGATAQDWIDAGLAVEADRALLEGILAGELEEVRALDGRPSQQGDGALPYPPK